MRRSLAALRQGRPGPVMVEIPADVAMQDVSDFNGDTSHVKPVKSQGDPRDIEAAAKALCSAQRPVILAGQGVLYAEATEELRELSEFLAAPVLTTLMGKSAFPESHPLALGCGTGSMPKVLHHFLHAADLICGIGCSFTDHVMAMRLPEGRTIIHTTNDPADVQKDLDVDYPIVGDAKLVLQQLLEACKDITGNQARSTDEVAAKIASINGEWLNDWMPKLTSDEIPITPFRVIWDLMQAIPPEDAIVTHDAGSPRERMISFYRSAGPRSFIGWGRSHALGTGLGLIIGAKLAKPEKSAPMSRAIQRLAWSGWTLKPPCGKGSLLLLCCLTTVAWQAKQRVLPRRSIKSAISVVITQTLRGRWAVVGSGLNTPRKSFRRSNAPGVLLKRKGCRCCLSL